MANRRKVHPNNQKPETETESATTEEATPDRTHLDNRPSLGALFGKFKVAAQAVEDAKAALEAAKGPQSEAVAAILEHYGPGPYEFRGELLKIRKRKNLAYFVSQGTKDATVIQEEEEEAA